MLYIYFSDTALHLAANNQGRWGEEIVTALLDAGADKNAKNNTG